MSNIPDNIVVKREWGTVEYATKLNGRMPAEKFIDDLKNETKSEWLQLATLFEFMAENGKISNEQKFKKLKGEIWEFKSKRYRVLCFQKGNSWILTNGFKKQGKTIRKETGKAQAIMNEHLEVVKGKGI